MDFKVIVHLDLDAFYAQVEAKRVGLDARRDAVGVVQWDSLLAVSYPARAAGVTRFDTPRDARRKCDGIACVHVEYLDLKTGASIADPAAAPDRSAAKVSLARYRRASRAVLDALVGAAGGATIERASIDEVYVDVTAAAAAGGGSEDARLARGGVLATALRDAVFSRTGFTSSAGVSTSKFLAKLASSRHKPARTTVVSRAEVPDVMHATPLLSINGYGGKEGLAIQAALGVSDDATAARALDALIALEGRGAAPPFAARLRALVLRGDDGAAVVDNLRPKSLNVFKSFPAAERRAAVVAEWLRLLAAELAERADEDAALNDRRPAKFTLGRRGDYDDDAAMRTKTTRAPASVSGPSLAAAAALLLKGFDGGGLPCSRLQLSLGDFAAVASGRSAITSFFGAQKRPAAPPRRDEAPPRSGEEPWSCSACTLTNARAAVACACCGAARPHAGAGWDCAACTLRNPEPARTCAACGGAGPARARKRQRTGDIRDALGRRPP